MEYKKIKEYNFSLSILLIFFICIQFLSFHYITTSKIINSEKINFSEEKSELILNQDDSKKTDCYFQKLKQYDLSYGAMRDLYVNGNFVYTANERGGLIVFNIANPFVIDMISTYDEERSLVNERWDSGGLTSSVFEDNSIAFLADGKNGLILLNVSQPSQPIKISQYKDVEEGIYKVHIQNKFAYTYGTRTMKILNVSDTINPRLISEIDFYQEGIFIYDYQIYKDYLFVSSNDLLVFNVSDPYNPTEIFRIFDSNGIKISVVDDNFVYVLSSYVQDLTQINSFKIYNITTHNSPNLLCELSIGNNYPNDIKILENIAYISTSKEIIAFDISNKTNPIQLGLLNKFSFSGSDKKIAIQKTTLNDQINIIVFCADYNEGLFIFNFTNPLEPKLINYYSMGKKYTRISSWEDIICVVSWSQFPNFPCKLEIFQLSNNIISFKSSLVYNCSIAELLVYDEIVFLGTSDGLEILNISNLISPQIITKFNDFSSGCFIEKIFLDIDQQFLYLANYWFGITIIDVSNYTNPILVNEFNFYDMLVVDIFIHENIAYVADGRLSGGYALIDIFNPNNPQLIKMVFLDETTYSVYVQDNYLLLCTDQILLRIIDITTPTSPYEISQYSDNLLVPANIDIRNNTAFITHQGNGLYAIDISKPKYPKILTNYRDYYAGISYDVYVQGDYIFLADGWDGLEILKLVPPKITFRNYLLMTILPPVGGVCLIAIIVILQYSKRKVDPNS
ncbi:MAG: hypothetical protein FK730_10765 [Asgard group archaeon]|nr:hypothetical protein [Asgard group archaeon]